MILLYTAILLTAYLLGSVPFGLLVGKSQGVDVRTLGSKNIGATNVWRVLGKKCGLLTFFLDAAKGWLAVQAAFWLTTRGALAQPADPALAGIAAAACCILGHSFPVWLKFKGGKGVATSLGVIIGLLPLASLIIFAIWGVVFKITRYVSLASIIAAISLPLTVLGLRAAGQVQGWALFLFACAAALLVVRRHRDNIKRLAAGTEPRFGTAKPGDGAAKPTTPPSTPSAP